MQFVEDVERIQRLFCNCVLCVKVILLERREIEQEREKSMLE